MLKNNFFEVTSNNNTKKQNQMAENIEMAQQGESNLVTRNNLDINELIPNPEQSNFFSLCCKKYLKFIVFVIVCFALGISSFFILRRFIPDKPSTSPTENFQEEEEQVYEDKPYVEGQPTEEIYDLVLRNSTSALCLDGSPGSYYISRSGDPSRILLFFQPGGWCGDKDYYSTLWNCYHHSLGRYGNSKHLQPTWRQDGNALSLHPDNYFRNWKKIHLNYCDGSGHQGTRKQPFQIGDKLIYFRGHNITTENFADLQQKIGLFSKTKKIVVTGLSAGGMAAMTWANYVKDHVKKAKVYALSDSGIFYDVENFETKTHFYKTSLANLLNITNQEIDPPNPECIKDYPDSKQNCLLAQNLHKYLRVPLFAIQSTYDIWLINNILKVKCNGIRDCSSKTDEEKNAIKQHAKYFLNLLPQIGKTPQNGVFGIDCMIHGMMYYYTYTSKDFTIPAGSGRTVDKAIGQWIDNTLGDNVHIEITDWPSNQGCAKP